MDDKKKHYLVSLICGIIISMPMLFFSGSICRSLGDLSAPKVELEKGNSIEKVSNKEQTERKRLVESISSVRKRLDRFIPNEHYLIVNSSDNVFTVKKGKTVVRKGLCSTGSYVMLKSHGDREWIFKTPRGRYEILSKKESPVWHMPDWAFIEEGKPVPPPGAAERYEHGVLGDYALTLGKGYMIHGTLYQRFLGLPVSHGCIRLGDDDLEYVYKNTRVGSKVYLY